MTTYDPVRAQRVPTSIVATVTAGKRSSVFTILNVSITGAKLEGPLSLALKETIKIRFAWEGTAVELAAEVVRVDSPDLMTDQIAAHFIDVPEDANAALQDLVSRMLDAGGEPSGPEEEDTGEAEIVMEPED